MKPKVLITGANGFVGSYLNKYLLSKEYSVTSAIRSIDRSKSIDSSNTVAVGDINSQTDWSHALSDIDTVIHLAARVHVMEETEADPLEAFREVNTRGTIKLARDSVKKGVKRFVYLSTIKVNGEETGRKPFSPEQTPNPTDPYGISKFEAEVQLAELSKETGLEIVIIRPPLVYGPGVKGNFARLVQFVKKGVPLPLANTDNKRSLVYIGNLCSLIEKCISCPEAKGETFLASDDYDLSTTELFTLIAAALETKSRLFFLPTFLVRWIATLVGKKSEFNRLYGSLQVDIAKNRTLLGWAPTWTPEVGIKSAIHGSE